MTVTICRGVGTAHRDDVVAVELVIDGLLLVADRLDVIDFPPVLGIRPNIAEPELRTLVWERVASGLTAQGVLDARGAPHPEVAAMVDVCSRADRTLEGRWWRRDAGRKMVRFAVCRRAGRHVVAVRDGDVIVMQRVAAQVGLAAMVTAVLGSADAADVEPLTATVAALGRSTTAQHVARLGVDPTSAKRYADVTAAPRSWVEITAAERHSGGTHTRTAVAAGVLDSCHGRIVSVPRRVNGELYGSLPFGAGRRGSGRRRPGRGGRRGTAATGPDDASAAGGECSWRAT